VTRLPGAAAGEVHEVARSLDRAAFFPVERPQSPGAELRIGALGSARHGGDALRTALREFGVDAAIVELDGPFDALDERGRGALLRGLDLLAVLEVGARAAFVPAVPEALACGLPCVLADGPATRASVGGRSDAALFVEPGDARDLAEAIVFVARNQRLRDQLRRAAVEAAAAQTAARHADELEQAVRRIAARARGPRRAETARPPADAGDGADLVHALALRAQRHIECGDLEAATACVKAAIEAVPASPLLWVQLAEIRAQSGDAVGALDATEHALEAGNSSCRLHELRARVLEQLARPSDALAALAQASRSEDAPAEVFRALARRLRQRGAVEAASQAEREAAVRAACG
jgi:Tfp pilus assembly protein PilF